MVDMDPNNILREIRHNIRRLSDTSDNDMHARSVYGSLVADGFAELDVWLSARGPLPDAWAPAAATSIPARFRSRALPL